MTPEKKREIEENVVTVLRTVFDPEIPVNIYDLGLIYEIGVSEEADVRVLMTLTSPSCPVAETMPGDVKMRVEMVKDVRSCEVELTFDPPWDQSMLSEEARLELGFL